MRYRITILISLILIIGIVIASSIFVLTPQGSGVLVAIGLETPTPSFAPMPLPPTPVPRPILTVQGAAPVVNATASYLVDMDTGHVLEDVHGEQLLPMASTTKIMTAIIAIQTGNLDQPVTIKQDAYDRVHNDGGSSAQLVVGDTLPLRELVYGMMLPSGDDAAVAIADALAGSPDNFVQRMNLFAYHLRLFQTHYSNPDGLTLDDNLNNLQHYTTAADLVRLARYAMSIPLFSQIVQTKTHVVEASGQHHKYSWTNTNTMLDSYTGMMGIKTGFTFAAGYCLVFAATRDGYHIIGAVLHSSSETQRVKDVTTLLDWGFALPRKLPSL
ncbi:MAG TPA: serine hydrolase [Ktedonobacteraceae bacterium]|nr:serine hydrolase [Ktedonobacteraceae bacterium]